MNALSGCCYVVMKPIAGNVVEPLLMCCKMRKRQIRRKKQVSSFQLYVWSINLPSVLHFRRGGFLQQHFTQNLPVVMEHPILIYFSWPDLSPCAFAPDV